MSSMDTLKVGALGGTRTPDALLRTETLYPLSYEGAPVRLGYPGLLIPPLCRNGGNQGHG